MACLFLDQILDSSRMPKAATLSYSSCHPNQNLYGATKTMSSKWPFHRSSTPYCSTLYTSYPEHHRCTCFVYHGPCRPLQISTAGSTYQLSTCKLSTKFCLQPVLSKKFNFFPLPLIIRLFHAIEQAARDAHNLLQYDISMTAYHEPLDYRIV